VERDPEHDERESNRQGRPAPHHLHANRIPVRNRIKPRRRCAVGCAFVHTIELTDEELRLVRSALHAYLEDFGHEEADVLRALKRVLAKLPPDE
jgi:hypothetical protein